ncbi:MAG: phospho-N-acetylmuramoyl-pentapeptide-transferase [Acidimicrobiales bacterium]
MVSLLISGGVALIFALVGTPLLIRSLRARGIGQQIREDGPEGHITKAGTPTMGGIVIVGGAVLGYAAGHLRTASAGHLKITAVFTTPGLTVVFALVGAGIVGLVDDWIKVRQRRNLGLNKRAKIVGQLTVAVIFVLLAVNWAHVNTRISFVRQGDLPIHLDVIAWSIFAALVLIGSSNAVNLTDGLDGLAAGSAAFACSALVVIGFWQFRHPSFYKVVHASHALDLALIATGMVGACVGFLWWNAAPARIFMGDVGSLAIGAGLAALCLMLSVDLLLPIVGGLFVLETVSVMLQVGSFRLLHRRVFRMAPVHHHFELGGWPETTVIIRFWILAGMCTALALGLFYYDFISLGGID